MEQAGADYNKKLKKKIENMGSSDRQFWSLIKDISGLDSTRSSSAPSAEDLVDHFAEKMKSGKDDIDNDFSPMHDSSDPLINFKIRFKRVLKCLRSLDPSKSANGVGPRVLKECADELAPPVYKLLKFIVRKSQYPGNWKVGRVPPVHKRGSVAAPSNYRPVTVLDDLQGVFEGITKPQFESWIS